MSARRARDAGSIDRGKTDLGDEIERLVADAARFRTRIGQHDRIVGIEERVLEEVLARLRDPVGQRLGAPALHCVEPLVTRAEVRRRGRPVDLRHRRRRNARRSGHADTIHRTRRRQKRIYGIAAPYVHGTAPVVRRNRAFSSAEKC